MRMWFLRIVSIWLWFLRCAWWYKNWAPPRTQYSNYILPPHPQDLSLKEIIAHLTAIAGERSSVFTTRCDCLRIAGQTEEDILTHADRVSRECGRFLLKTLIDGQFKSLRFVSGLISVNGSDIRTCLLARLDSLGWISKSYQWILQTN